MKNNLFNKVKNTKNSIKFLLVFMTSLFLILMNFYSYLSPHPAYASGSTYGYAISLIQTSGDNIISSDPLNHLDSQRPYDDPSYDCSALFEGATALQSTDPTRATNFKNYATSIANYLVIHKDDNNNGLVGWGLTFAWDAFGNGTTNPANTEYSYQTPLAARCLLDAYTTTSNNTYLQTAEDAVTAFQNASTATTFNDPQCSSCFYFGYSLNANDNGRLVKNVNMLMGMIVAKLSTITGISSYTTLANTLFKTEQYEINTRSNFNYLGFNDPHYVTNQSDSHLALELWGIEDLGTNISGLAYQTPLLSLKTAFWNCGSACQATTLSDYGMFASCYLAGEDTFSKNQCITSISLFSSATVQSHVDATALIGVINALPALLTVTPTPTPTMSTSTPTPTLSSPAQSFNLPGATATPTNIPENSYNTITSTPIPASGNFLASTGGIGQAYSVYLPTQGDNSSIINTKPLEAPSSKNSRSNSFWQNFLFMWESLTKLLFH